MNQLFIDREIKKCDRKLAENDFDGAITDARSLLEAVPAEVEQELLPAEAGVAKWQTQGT